MDIGLLTFQIVIPHSRSLKDKRQVIRSLRDRLKKFNVSIAECDHKTSAKDQLSGLCLSRQVTQYLKKLFNQSKMRSRKLLTEMSFIPGLNTYESSIQKTRSSWRIGSNGN